MKFRSVLAWTIVRLGDWSIHFGLWLLPKKNDALAEHLITLGVERLSPHTQKIIGDTFQEIRKGIEIAKLTHEKIVIQAEIEAPKEMWE